MIISENKIRGLVVVCLILAAIPFIVLFQGLSAEYNVPAFADQLPGFSAVEIVRGNRSEGIYFVDNRAALIRLLKNAGVGESAFRDLPLYNGMKILIDTPSEKNRIVVADMEPGKSLALGIRFDINRATQEDLLLVKGIGEETAAKILDLRGRLGRFRNMEQLMEIRGIKEKKLAEIRKYLYVAKRQT